MTYAGELSSELVPELTVFRKFRKFLFLMVVFACFGKRNQKQRKILQKEEPRERILQLSAATKSGKTEHIIKVPIIENAARENSQVQVRKDGSRRPTAGGTRGRTRRIW